MDSERGKRPADEKKCSKLVVHLTRFRHRGGAQIGLHFTDVHGLKDHLLTFKELRYSRTHSCFYIPDKSNVLRQLVDHCRGVVWLALRDLSTKSSSDGQKNHSTGKRDGTQKSVSFGVMLQDKISKYKDWMQQRRYSPATIRTYLSFVQTFFAQHPTLAWNGLTKDLINTYNHDHFIKRQRSYSAQNQWINAVKLYLRVHDLDIGDLSEIDRPRKGQSLPDVLSPGEVKKIIEAIANVKHRTLLMLIYSCGLRIGEALALKLKDIRSDEELIYIRAAKGNKDRRVPLSPLMLKQLRTYYHSYKPKHYLFEGQSGGKYSNKSAANVLKRSVHKVGITKRVTLHTLRHSYATHITQRGVGLRYVQEILGHKSPKTTMLYTHLSGRDIRTVKSPLDDLGL